MNNKLLFLPIFCFIVSLISAQEIYKPNAPRTLIEVEIQAPFSEKTIKTKAHLVGDKIVIGGDVVIGYSGPGGRGLGAILSVDRRWAKGIIPYIIDDGHPSKDLILEAIQEINDKTNLNIIERTDETDYVRVTNTADGCYKLGYVGRTGGVDTVNIQSGVCGKGSIIHEFLHAAGFFHEHTRRDRGEYIIVNEENIQPVWLSQFEKYEYGEGIAMGEYDYSSIMHYGASAFAIDPTKPTITTKDKTKQGLIGQRAGLSRQDIRQINRIYRADGVITDYSKLGRGGSSDTSWEIENPQSLSIQYEVELVPQLTGMSCWAAGAAMLVGWRDLVCINPEEIPKGIGYWSQYYNDGLPPDDTTMFRYWGLVAEPPQSYTVEGLIDLVANYGPLWVASAEPGPHIRVIAGIEGDGTPDGTILTIYDPWQRGMRNFRMPNFGSIYTETYTEFTIKQNELAKIESNILAPIYVAHN